MMDLETVAARLVADPDASDKFRVFCAGITYGADTHRNTVPLNGEPMPHELRDALAKLAKDFNHLPRPSGLRKEIAEVYLKAIKNETGPVPGV